MKTTSIPKSLFLTPSSKSIMLSNTVEDDVFQENFNLHESFESYEVFEYLTNKVIRAFETGSLDVAEGASYEELKSFLYENKISLETIFTFLNPQSQKEKQDYNYIVQGAVSAITTSMMSFFKEEDDKLHITLTNDENSLNLEKLSEATADFLKEMIGKDFDIKRGDVSELAKTVIAKYQDESEKPFSVSIPEGTEFDSFRTMVEMNGTMKFAIPFSTQEESPLWSDEKVLDDKMVQIVDESIKTAINKMDIGKAILKNL